MYCYGDAFRDLAQQWHSNPSYSHVALAVPMSLWLLWHRRSYLPKISNPWGPGFVLLMFAHCMLAAGDYFYLPALQRWSIPVWLCGMIGVCWGRNILLWSLPSVEVLVFVLPLPFQMETAANEFLQSSSAWSSCYLLSLVDTLAVTDGYTLSVEAGKIAITEDCSGLHMTVAIVAMSYFIHCLQPRGQVLVQRDKVYATAIQYFATVIFVIPTVVLSNAMRISILALDIRFDPSLRFTAWAHDVGNWAVLPVAAGMFIAFKTWLDRLFACMAAGKLTEQTADYARITAARTKANRAKRIAYARLAILPVLGLLLSIGTIWNYNHRKQLACVKLLGLAQRHEALQDWTEAEACYCKLRILQPKSIEIQYQRSWVELQNAYTLESRRKVMYQLENILCRSPNHEPSLKTHLSLALELDSSAAALRSAERLYHLRNCSHPVKQMQAEAVLRFAGSTSNLPEFSLDNLQQMLTQFGPAEKWRDTFTIAVAMWLGKRSSKQASLTNECDQAIVEELYHAVSQCARRLNTAEAHLACWTLEKILDPETNHRSLACALQQIDDQCPPEIAYEIYCESASVARASDQAPVAKRLLMTGAIPLFPERYWAFELLGDACHGLEERQEATAAYLRAWRLCGDRSLEFGIKLAESLTQIGMHEQARRLVSDLLHGKVKAAQTLPDRLLRIRLYFVKAQLEILAREYDVGLQTLKVCRALGSLDGGRVTAIADLMTNTEELRVQCWVHMGNYSRAARWFEQQARGGAQADAHWIAAARAWRSAGKPVEATICYRNAFWLIGQSNDFWLEYIDFLQRTAGSEAAIREIAYQKNRGREGQMVEPRILAQAWEIVGNSNKAIESYRSASQQTPSDMAALAIALARGGKLKQSLQILRDDKCLVEPSLRAHTAAMVGVAAGNLSETESTVISELVAAGLEVEGEDVALLLAAAEWDSKRKAYSSAIVLLERVVNLQPDNTVAGNNLAMLLAGEERDFERALRSIDHVISQAGTVAEFLDTKGWILVQMGRADEALTWLLKATELSRSSDPIFQIHLAAAFLAVGDREQASRYHEFVQRSELPKELLNPSEQRAWELLQSEFASQVAQQAGGEV